MNSQERLCGDARFVEIAETVDDYELAFDVWATKRNCAAANIVRKPGVKVWGVLYEVPDSLISRETAKALGRRSLDAIEGEGTNYKCGTIDVRRPDGRIVRALTYTANSPKAGLRTSLEYVGFIVEGLRKRGVDENYIARVKDIAAANNSAISNEVQTL